jgi:hypothetical protein
MKTSTPLKGTRGQRGAVAIMFGLTLVVLIGFAGLAIDLGRFFVIKSELQNAMDACALSAASQLKPGASDSNALIRAVAYGNVFSQGAPSDASIRNKANFQSMELDPSVLKITFGEKNDVDHSSTTDPNNARFVKCEYPLAGLPIFFMRVLNILPGVSIAETQQVAAMAVATRGAPLAPCIPVAVCASDTGTPADNFGYTPGQWMTAIDGSSYGTGHFGWGSLIAGDANQLKSELMGSSQCDISNPNQTIHGTGLMAGLADEWNSRFGLYRSNPTVNPSNAPPDHTGLAYSDAPASSKPPLPAGNWPPVPPRIEGFNAYFGSNSLVPTVPNFVTAASSNLPYNQNSPQPPGFPISQYPNVLNQADQQALGRTSRRVVAAPIVGCHLWDEKPPTLKHLPVKGWACVLMLNPYDESGSQNEPWRFAKLEFLGLASNASSPCSGGAEFAIAPVLTQ